MALTNRARKKTELGAREACPCGSGRSYGRCCKKRNFVWERDDKGNVFKAIKLIPEAVDLLKKQREEFKKVFLRYPRRNDPVFHLRYYMSEADFEREALDMLRQGNAPPQLVYAYRKTGLMTVDPGLLSPGEEAEIRDAVDEFYARVDEGEDEEEVVYGTGFKGLILEELRRNQIIGGYLIENHYNKYRDKTGSSRDIEAICAYCVSNFVRSLKSIHILIEQNASFDAHMILRSLYENYLNVKYVYEFPSEAAVFMAQLGTLLGTHRHSVDRRGSPVQSRFVEIKTNRVLEMPSRWKMACALGDSDKSFYQATYRRLSSFSHSEMTNIQYVISDEGFVYHDIDFSIDVLAGSHILTFLLLAILRDRSPCPKYLRRDLQVAIERSFLAILMIETSLVESGGDQFPEPIRAIVSDVVRHDDRLLKMLNSFAAA